MNPVGINKMSYKFVPNIEALIVYDKRMEEIDKEFAKYAAKQFVNHEAKMRMLQALQKRDKDREEALKQYRQASWIPNDKVTK